MATQQLLNTIYSEPYVEKSIIKIVLFTSKVESKFKKKLFGVFSCGEADFDGAFEF